MTKVLFPNVYRLTHVIIVVESTGDAERHSKEDKSAFNRASIFSTEVNPG